MEEYNALFNKAKPGQLCGDISPDYLYYYQNAVPKILNEINARVPVIIVLRNPIERAYSNYLHYVRDGREKLTFDNALDAEAERRAANWAWGWGYVDVGLYGEQVKAYMDNFERVLILLFEEDIVTGKAAGKVLDFLNLPSLPEIPSVLHENVSGYPKNRLFHRVTTQIMWDELIIGKIKKALKMTPLYAGSRRVYRKIMEANLKKEELDKKTRERLRDKFQKDVALLAEQTKLPIQKFWTDFQ